MQVEIFTLCDAATDQHGKLNILGTFDRIFMSKVPGLYMQCAVAARIRFTRVERGEHKILVTLVDADGRTVLPSLDTGIQVNFPDEYSSTTVNAVLALNRLQFNRFGEYSVDLAIDGRQEASLPLIICEPPTAGKA